MSAPRAVLFDLDGTLVDSMPSIAAALVETLASFGHETSVGELMPLFGPSMPLTIQQATGVSPQQAGDIYAAYLPRYYEQYMPDTSPIEGAEALLGALVAAGAPLAIVTSKIEQGARDLLANLGWTPHFSVVVGRETATAMKPAPEPALHALAALERSPSQAVFVGDTAVDMECARAAGIPTVVGFTLIRSAEELREAGATHVCGTLQAVGELLLGAASASAP